MADEDLVKQAIIDLARQQVDDGAHYLWGTAGNCPGESNGASYRPSHARLYANRPDLDAAAKAAAYPGEPYVPTLFAAWVNSSDKGKIVCAGRCAVEEVQAMDLACTITVAEALKLTLRKMTKEQLEEFQENSVLPYNYRWPRPNGSLGVAAGVTTVWGESCVGVRHFDCIGLVNYCFSTVLNCVWQRGIESFTNAAKRAAGGYVEVSPISSGQACDIVTRDSEHIGLVTNLGTVIEASETSVGLLERPIQSGTWNKCWRIPRSEFQKVDLPDTHYAGMRVPLR